MYTFGHVGLAVLIYFFIEQIIGKGSWMSNRNIFLIAVGSILPDILDKSVGVLIFSSGRWIGHTILFQSSFFLLLLGIGRLFEVNYRYFTDIKILYFGAIIHLLGDFPGINPQTLFWPFFGPFDVGPTNQFLFGFESIFVWITELMGLGILLIIGRYYSWEKREWLILIVLSLLYILSFITAYTLLVLL